MSESNKTLILGNGPCTRSVGEELLARGAEIIVAANDVAKENDAALPSAEKRAEVLTNATLLSCRGSVGDFHLSFSKESENISRTVANIVISEEAVRKPNFSLYGLSASSYVTSLSELSASLSDRADGVKKTVVFLTGLVKESNPVILEEIMQTSLRLQQESDAQVYIMTKNLKVGGNGLEALYRKTREAGAVYIKFTDTLPEIRQEEDGRVTVSFTDEIMQEAFSLKPDMTVVDETVSPSDYMAELAEIFQLHTDTDGFLQAENVHRISAFTNRKGILVAGLSRSVQSSDEQIRDAENAVISLLNLRADSEADLSDKAEIGVGCAKCLTCYRVCPYRAIQIAETKPEVMPQACEQCGLCASVCPACVITIKGLTPADISDRITAVIPQKQETFIPFLVAFCCKRSAIQAGELASQNGHNLPEGLKTIEVPCAGSISQDHIFSAFKKGADGVLVLTCHEGNCHSEYGNIYAQKRADRITDILSETGFGKERLVVKTLASNMAKEFAEIADTFEKRILELGPSKLS